jgi:hypothetical protein
MLWPGKTVLNLISKTSQVMQLPCCFINLNIGYISVLAACLQGVSAKKSAFLTECAQYDVVIFYLVIQH